LIEEEDQKMLMTTVLDRHSWAPVLGSPMLSFAVWAVAKLARCWFDVEWEF
jgi:hypothetical protein